MNVRRYESTLRREQQEATRERILTALADLLTEHAPSSYAAVAERAGVAERTVYRHFPTRNELFSALFASVTAVVGDAPDDRSVDDLTATVRMIFDRYDRRPEVIRALQSAEGSEQMRKARAGSRRAMVTNALAEDLAGLGEEERRRVEAAVHVLASSTAFLHLRDFWDMSAEESADVVCWAVETLVAAARGEGEHGRATEVGTARRRRVGR